MTDQIYGACVLIKFYWMFDLNQPPFLVLFIEAVSIVYILSKNLLFLGSHGAVAPTVHKRQVVILNEEIC